MIGIFLKLRNITFGLDKESILWPTKKDTSDKYWTNSNFIFKLKNGDSIKGSLYSRTGDDLYIIKDRSIIDNRKIIYVFSLQNVSGIYDDEDEVSEEVLSHAKEKYVDNFIFTLIRID